MSSENMVEKEIDASSPRMELTLRSVAGDSNAISAETPATATDLVVMTKDFHDRERPWEKVLTQAEASEAASNNPAIQLLEIEHLGTFYIQNRVLILDRKVERERELFDRLTQRQKLKSVAEAEKKKAEHKRYKAKKKAEAAARRQAEKEAANEVEEEVAEEAAEASEPPKSQAELQAEEDTRLGDRRLEQQAKRQEQEDRLASLVNAKQGSIVGVRGDGFKEGRRK